MRLNNLLEEKVSRKRKVRANQNHPQYNQVKTKEWKKRKNLTNHHQTRKFLKKKKRLNSMNKLKRKKKS